MIKIRYLGKTPRTFPLPLPLLSGSAKTGEVVCDPVGEFPDKDGEYLLKLAPDVFRRVDSPPVPRAVENAPPIHAAEHSPQRPILRKTRKGAGGSP